MSHKVLSIALFSASLFVASCGAAAVGDSAESPAPHMIETVTLDAASPFMAEAHLELNEGWAISVEPDTGNLLLTEKGGTAKYYNPATGVALEVSGLPSVAYGAQGGLGDIAFAPDYATSGMIYLSWAQAAEGDARRAVAARGRLECSASACAITGLSEIWRQEPAVTSRGHFSYKFAFSLAGQHLFIASGDRMQADPAQDNSNTLGTIVRINLDGTPAAGNPFADQPSPTNQIWSYGHRNISGLEFDATGQLWDVEHGPRGGDEFNMVEPGNNYGWPVRSYGDNYNGSEIPDHTADDPFVKPAIFWSPVIAPGGMVFYRGAMFSAWRGQALIANLGSQTLVRVATDAATGTATEEARYSMPRRLRDIAEAADGSLWVIEDGGEGRLLRLTPRM